MSSTIKIWDPVVRIVHWSLVGIFITNYFIIEAGGSWHQWLGYSAATLVLLRLIWGLFPSGYARIRAAIINRAAISAHITHLKERHIPTESGHNPIGWLMVFATWLLFIALAVTGFMLEEIDALFGNSLLQDFHALAANTLYAIAIIHIIAVIVVGWWGRIPLIPPMITGQRKKRD
ncbi:cytochrome B [Pseudoalteromonas sp. CO325X]|uniref:cytochrome b/b6 domain-containing protein n=1 Tax=Pseudoalteromonas sp. CO325X TaxID=1777262 RepID=UPI001023C566|nr:cytochrome b/b6 domain-containing protein [Pseudoalteromonas sp. CO325X]RZF80174.1 cytochrome B [Pseudoalteromonas sp. CO325X]